MSADALRPLAPARPRPRLPGAPRRLRRAAALVLLLGVAACGGGPSGAPPPAPTRPNVLLITLDTTRADRLGSYGYAAASTPNLDRLAAGGVRFTRALSPVPLTLPAHASLMTGRNPFRHGVRNNGHYALPTDVPTLAEQFRDAGYDTAAFVSSFVLDRQFGLARGFAVYDDTLDHASSTSAGAMTSLEVERRGDRTVAAATAWLRTRRPTGAAAAGAPGRPYFLWVHLYDAHDPYTPPAPYADRFAATPYDGELAFVDAQVGALLTAAGEVSGAPPLVAVAGDHGESLGEHGESTHGLFVYDSAIRVPLILSWPGGLEPRVVEPTVRLVDLAPTLTALAGVPGAPAGVDGRDVTPLARGLAPPETQATQDTAAHAAYAETLFPQFFMNWAPLRAIDDGRWKFVDAPEPELYDVAADPQESSNRYAAEPAVARRLKAQLESTLRAAEERSAPTPMSADAQRKLSALGYVGAPAAGSGSASAPRPDPKRMVGRFQQLLDGNRALAANRPGEAVRLAREVLAVDPENAFARLVLGRGLLATGDAVGAATALMAYLAAVPGSADAHHWLALAYLRQDRRLKALDEEEAALALDPRHAAAASLRAGLLFSDGRVDDGIEALRAAVDGQPAHVGLRLDFADLLADARRPDEAEAEYRRVLGQRPDDVRALAGLGMLHARAGRLEPALEQLTRALDLDPRHEEARIERAAVLSRLGRAAESRADLQRLTGPEVRPDIRRAAQKQLTGR